MPRLIASTRSLITTARNIASARTPLIATPDLIANLQLWLKADSLTGLADADPVSTWNDSSANQYSATQSGANRPIYKKNIINTFPVVRFNGSSSMMNLGSNALGMLAKAQGATIIGVFNSTDFTGVKDILTIGTSDSATTRRFGIQSSSSNFLATIRRIDGTGATFLTGATVLVTNTWYIGSAVQNYNAATCFIYENGKFDKNTLAAATPGNVSDTNSVTISIGNNGNVASGATNWFAGDIAELIVFNRRLTDPERWAIEQYLATKYKIALTGGAVTSRTLAS